MLSRSRECWRQVTIFAYPFSLSPCIRTEDTRGLFHDATRQSTVHIVVVRMSQRHAFVAYNCSCYIVSFFLRLSPFALLSHHDCCWRTPGCPRYFRTAYLYTRRDCQSWVLIDAAEFGSEDTPRRMSGGKIVLYVRYVRRVVSIIVTLFCRDDFASRDASIFRANDVESSETIVTRYMLHIHVFIVYMLYN